MESKLAFAPGGHKPAAANPVMDVVAPPATEEAHDSPDSSNEVDPLDKLAAEDKASRQELTKEKEVEKQEQRAKKQAKSKQPAGAGMAIAATVIIVLGLAGLATYAYLQTAK